MSGLVMKALLLTNQLQHLCVSPLEAGWWQAVATTTTLLLRTVHLKALISAVYSTHVH